MLCALTVRQLKPGTFEQFTQAFTPAADAEPPAGWRRFTLLRDTADEDRVVTFGHFDGTLDELNANQREQGYDDRRAAADEYVDQVLVNGVFEVVTEIEAQAQPH
jgi:hypothetical protein